VGGDMLQHTAALSTAQKLKLPCQKHSSCGGLKAGTAASFVLQLLHEVGPARMFVMFVRNSHSWFGPTRASNGAASADEAHPQDCAP